ncbi:DNA primase, partial [Halobacterium salinarum]|nr:DNA primase [Halobacterium salinarum]
DALARIREVPAAEVVDAVADADSVPAVVVADATITQRLLDVAAQRGVASLIGADTDEFVKQPLATRVRTLDDART